MTPEIYDSRACALGEGPLWHPERQQLFWFDILNRRMLSLDRTGALEWRFPGLVSACGWVDRSRLLIASETALTLFDVETGASEQIAALEADQPANRSNDGRADPQGGFWIGTMGKQAEPGAGAIWRYYRGELRRLYDGITVTNAICFPGDGGHAFFTDTATCRVMRVATDADGWPGAAPEIFLDLAAEKLKPDGAVFDAEGRMWIAHWGAARLSAYDMAARRVADLHLPAAQVTCPAFGGAGLATLYATTARTGLSETDLAGQPDAGKTFAFLPGTAGLAENRVILG